MTTFRATEQEKPYYSAGEVLEELWRRNPVLAQISTVRLDPDSDRLLRENLFDLYVTDDGCEEEDPPDGG